MASGDDKSKRRGRKLKIGESPVRIQEWLRKEGLSSAQLEAASDTRRTTMQKIRAGRDVRLSTIKKVLKGAREVSNRQVAVEELFDFDS